MAGIIKKWKEQEEQNRILNERCEELLEQNKKLEIQIAEQLKKEKEQEEKRKEQYKEQNEELERNKKRVYDSAIKIYLYSQLLKEESETEPQMEASDAVIKECQNILQMCE